MTATLFRLLGPLEVVVEGRAVPLGGRKPRMLLAALLLQPGVTVSKDHLAEVLWPDSPPASAAANLRTYVHFLRARLEGSGAGLERSSSGYLLTVEPGLLDTTLFEDRLAEARTALGGADPRSALALLTEAERLWRGPALADLPHSHTWGAPLARLAELRLGAHELRLRTRVDLGEYEEAVAELRGLLEKHPLREEFWLQLVRALDLGGRRAEAVTAYTEAEQVLRDELDARPGPRLRELYATLSTAPAPTRPPPPAPAQAPGCRLPLNLPDFTGRRDCVTELAGLIRRRGTEGLPTVAVLSGPPGVGKSAVAVHVAHAVREEFPDGQLHLALGGTTATPRRPGDLLAELLRALGVPDSTLPRQQTERAALLRARLTTARLCVVLDDAADAAQVRPLLPGAGTCAVLVTSRARLPDLAGATPVELDVLPPAEAKGLLTAVVGEDRAAAEPEAADELLDSCGHLPLAIRVAGAKLAHRPGWTLRMFADRLSDERRRLDELRVGDLAVRASVTLSYDQLPGSAARALRGLGCLGAVRFPAWAAAAVLDRVHADDVLDVLLDAHLVEPVGTDAAGRPRYRLHDLLRCYAAERAEHDDGEARLDVARRVLEGYLELALEATERMPVRFFGLLPARDDRRWVPDESAGLLADPVAWFEAEHHTGVAAVSLAARLGLDDLAWRLAAAFLPYFDLRDHHDDWMSTHRIGLDAAKRTGDARGQAILLRNLGQLLIYQDDYDGALASFMRAHALFLAEGDERGAAVALTGRTTVHRILGEHDAGLRCCHEALTLFARTGDRHGEAVARLAIGSLWLARGCTATADRWFSEARELAAELGDRHRQAHALQRQALLHQRRGRLGAARQQLDEAIAIFTELGDDRCVGYAHQSLGELCLCSGDLAHAQLLLVNSLSATRLSGDRRSEAEVSERLGELHDALGQPERSRRYYASALALWRELDITERAQRLLPGRRDDAYTAGRA
ncbi:AfsR/SARP family transcriptional regulator [Prauserella cavernicola]|uniref:AfsR/SARP family transcriptional regulator n=1 Tax=Prauserella cavernicola TaxID=2800127 RepID=UPI0027DBB15E|nr:BTAD domain-containing putative transcriptional regulator [Prauserella cavernicola]